MIEKDSIYFSHDSNASDDPKLIALVSVYGMTGYGQWWRLVEILRAHAGYRYNISSKFSYPALAKSLMCSRQEVEQFVKDCIEEFELLKTDGECIWSESLIRRMETWDNKKAAYSERGKKGAAATNAKKSAQAAKVVGTSAAQATKNAACAGENSGKENIVNKESKETTPPPETLLLPVEELAEGALKDDFLTIAAMTQAKVTPEQLPAAKAKFPEVMQDFVIHLKSEGKHMQTFQGFRNHFKNWFARRIASKPPPAPPGKAQALSATELLALRKTTAYVPPQH